MSEPLGRLRAGLALVGVPLCAGIDPDPHSFPAGLPHDARGLEIFAGGLVRAVAPHVVAVKFNLAFFEALGSDGWLALERVRASVPASLVVVLDGKRGDIGSSAERSATALLDRLGADAVTLSPYLGEDAVEPFLARPGRLVYLLARTSNPSAPRFQELDSGGRPLAERIAAWAAERWPEGRVGLVVGATAAVPLRRLRAVAPALPFLVPGVGAQGGDVEAAVGSCHGTAAPGLVSISRGIAAAASGAEADWRLAAAEAAAAWRNRMLEAGATLATS